MPPRLRRARFTLIELIVTLAIFSALAGLGAWGSRNMVPRWHTRSMAYKVKSDLERCRAIAIQYGSYCRMKITTYDNLLGTNKASKGAYQIQWCNTTLAGDTYANGLCWDTLPIDKADWRAGSQKVEGTINFATAAKKKTSISGFGGASGDPHNIAWTNPVTNANSIVFDSYGALVNPAANYTADGHLYIDIANKYVALRDHELECYVVRVGINGAKSGNVSVSRVDDGCPLSVAP